jgi:hypothetical protein
MNRVLVSYVIVLSVIGGGIILVFICMVVYYWVKKYCCPCNLMNSTTTHATHRKFRMV